MIKKLINEIKNEYKRNKILTLFIGATMFMTLLTYLKPSSTSSILNYIGFTALNLLSLTIIVFMVWFVFIRKKGSFKLR